MTVNNILFTMPKGINITTTTLNVHKIFTLDKYDGRKAERSGLPLLKRFSKRCILFKKDHNKISRSKAYLAEFLR